MLGKILGSPASKKEGDGPLTADPPEASAAEVPDARMMHAYTPALAAEKRGKEEVGGTPASTQRRRNRGRRGRRGKKGDTTGDSVASGTTSEKPKPNDATTADASNLNMLIGVGSVSSNTRDTVG